MLYGILIHDSEGTRHHIEVGLVRCDNASIDGTCPGGRAFAERYNGNSYFCNPGADFNNDILYFGEVERSSGSDISPTGTIWGTSITQTGFYTTDTTKAYAWGEVTGGGNCPTGNARGYFDGWERLLIGNGGWDYVNNSEIYHYATGISSAPCWGVSGTVSGDFNVS